MNATLFVLLGLISFSLSAKFVSELYYSSATCSGSPTNLYAQTTPYCDADIKLRTSCNSTHYIISSCSDSNCVNCVEGYVWPLGNCSTSGRMYSCVDDTPMMPGDSYYTLSYTSSNCQDDTVYMVIADASGYCDGQNMDTCNGGHVSSTVCSDPSPNCEGSSCTQTLVPNNPFVMEHRLLPFLHYL